MGQDRNFTDQEIQIAQETIQNFKEIWNKCEAANLKHD